MMGVTEYIKSEGLAGLRDLATRSGVAELTLRSWYETRRFVFNAILEKCIRNSIDREGRKDCPVCNPK